MPDELAPGSKIGQYQVVSTLGSGGMSRVYLCEDLVLHRRVAVKQLLTSAIDSRSAIRLQHEGQALARLHHPNIVQIYSSFASDDGAPYLVMELLHGCELSDYLSERGSLNVGQVLQIAEQLCDALQHAHSEGIIHRDIKPSNIFLFNKKLNAVKIIDFGIAKNADNQVNATRTGEFVGSPTYISPEQALQKPITAQTDQYSLACVLYECLVGHPPFQDTSPMGLIMKHVQEAPPSLGKKTFVPKKMAKAIERALRKEPDQRFESMDAFFAEMSDAGSNSSGTLTKKGLSIIAAVVGVGVVATICGAMFMIGDHQAPPPVVRSISDTPSAIPLAEKVEPNDPNSQQYVQQLILRKPDIHKIDLSGRPVGTGCLRALTDAKELRILNLSQAALWDTAAKYINEITWLEELHASKNEIGDNFLSYLTKLHKLKLLTLNDTRITSASGKYLSNMPNLETILMRDTNINDAIADDLTKLKKLSVLDVSNSEVTDAFVHKIRTMSSVILLGLEGTRVTEKSFADMAEMRGLRRLYLDGTGSVEDISPLTKLPLQILHLRDVRLSARALKDLPKFKSIIDLRLDNNAITDQELLALASLPELRRLDVRACRLLTPQGIAKFKSVNKGRCDLTAHDKKSWEHPN